MTNSHEAAGLLRSIAVACTPDTRAARALLERAANVDVTVADGDRWTSYAAPDLSLALADPTELPGGAVASLNVKVPNVDATFADLVAAGAAACADPADGAHERRASVWLTGGIALTIYQTR